MAKKNENRVLVSLMCEECKNCEKMITQDFEDKPAFSIKCDCGGKAVRVYGEVGI